MDTEQQADQAFLEERDQKVAPRFVQYMDILSLSLMSVQVVEEAFAPSVFGIRIFLLLSNIILKNSFQYFGKSCP